MRCQCVECGLIYDIKEPYEQDDVTGGYCDLCFEIIMHNLTVQRDKKRKEGLR